MKTTLLLTLCCWYINCMAQDHNAAFENLFTPQDVTHTAVNNGSWFDENSWLNGSIPNNNAWVHIPMGIQITYDQLSNNRLHSVLVDGHLTFSNTQSSQMIVDTLLISHHGQLTIGTKNNPIPASTVVDIIIADNGDIDINRDPTLISRGIVAMGPVSIHGAEKKPHTKVQTAPMAGHTSITLNTSNHQWQVGDVLVITGTKFSGWKWDNEVREVIYHGTQDEVRTITAINGATISFDEPLLHDHFTPRADLNASVGNYSRNITIRSENGDASQTHHRGHVMFMHHANVDARYAAFWHLGRTDKSVASMEAADINPVTPNSNARGRYPFHFHRAGVTDVRNPGIAIGNAVFDSPGWGYVHHDSNATFHNNVSFDTFGAGFVAETGNEIGAWTHNLAVKAEGNSAFNPKNGNDREAFDMGRTGDGFWFQGRMVRATDNIAASVNHGYVYLHRGSGMLSFPREIFMLPDALRRNAESSADDAPILNFINNEAYGNLVGLYVVKANPNQQHNVNSVFENFTAWEVRAGAAIEYTAHYTFKNFDIIGKTPEAFSTPLFGMDFGTNTSDMTINNINISNMETGIQLGKDYTDVDVPPSANQYVVIDANFDNVNQNWVDYDENLDTVITSDQLNNNQFSIVINNNQDLEYNNPSTAANVGVDFIGTKTDSIGDNPIPSGTDQISIPNYDMYNICAQDGYYRTLGGTPYAIVPEYFTDRASGEIHKFGLTMLLGPAVDDQINNPHNAAWSQAFQAGLIDLNSAAPLAQDDHFTLASHAPNRLQLLTNDTDSDGDILTIDGIVQPKFGTVYDNQDGSVTYLPDFDFLGTDEFYYWATDRQGNFSKAFVYIESIDDLIYDNDFSQ